MAEHDKASFLGPVTVSTDQSGALPSDIANSLSLHDR